VHCAFSVRYAHQYQVSQKSVQKFGAQTRTDGPFWFHSVCVAPRTRNKSHVTLLFAVFSCFVAVCTYLAVDICLQLLRCAELRGRRLPSCCHSVLLLQARLYDVPTATDEELQHDPEVAASRNLELRVPHVPQHDRW
jgi:hypothetical protein